MHTVKRKAYIKAIAPALIILLLTGCNSDSIDVQVEKEFSIASTIDKLVLDGNIKNDEDIRVDFQISSELGEFSHLLLYWEHYSGEDTVRGGYAEIRAENFQQKLQGYYYTYFKSEEFLYELAFSNSDQITTNSKFELKWTAYNKDEIEIASNKNHKFVVDIQCPIKKDFLIGKYKLESSENTESKGEHKLFKNEIISITQGYYPNTRKAVVNFFDLEITLIFELFCGKIGISEKAVDVNCGNGIVFHSESLNTIDPYNDNKIIVDFIIDYYNNCGIAMNEQLVLTKINED